jgi:hypothetical protein
MTYLRRVGNTISVPIPHDKDGYLGRECPNPHCGGYFKIVSGTGLKGENLPCNCPYCGHSAPHDQFWTKEQIEYAKSVALRRITDALHKDLKSLEFEHKPQGGFGIGLSLKVERGHPTPIHYFGERQLQTEIVCGNCTLHYSVYGVFAFCPDCRQHNSLLILNKNLEVVGKMLDLAASAEKELADNLVENALEDCVSSFDGFGREFCRVYASKAVDPSRAERISFQNLDGARQNLSDLFTVDLVGGVTAIEWAGAVQGFQKRHLVSHKMGVVDAEYVRRSGDPQSVAGHKISIGADEVREISRIVFRLAQYMVAEVTRTHGTI